MTNRPQGKRERIQQLHQAAFTGRQVEIDLFRLLLPLHRNDETSLLMIYGIGGIGKSAILDEYARQAAAVNCWIARLDPRVQAGILDFLAAIHSQLRAHMRFPQYEAGLERRREIENRLLSRADIPRSALELLARGVRAAVQQVPLAGPVVAEFINPEQVAAAIYNAVGRAEGDFWLKPEEDLTNRLVVDLNAYVGQHRILLMFDNYEWIGDFDRWVREGLFEPLDSHALFVLAGRRRLEGRGWEEFSALIQQIELHPLNEAEARTYLEKKGIHDPAAQQVMADYADGLPLYLAILTELAEHGGGVGDLGHVATRQEFVDKLLERIKESLTANLSTALEACAVLRVVDEDNLAYMLDQPAIGPIFAAVKRLDFVKKRDDGGLMLHEVVWDAMNQELRWRNATRYCELHERAATYYEQALARPSVQNRERKVLERLYHHIRANEVEGIKLFQNIAEELAHYRLINRLRTLLGDFNNYALQDENGRLWRDYYNARLMHLEVRLSEAATVFQRIGEDEGAEPKLRAYALCDWADILMGSHRWTHQDTAQMAIRAAETSLRFAPQMDFKLLSNYTWLRVAYSHFLADWARAFSVLEQAQRYARELGDPYSIASVEVDLMALYARQGNWRMALDHQAQGVRDLGTLNAPYLRTRLLAAHWWAWTSLGRYYDTERYLRQSLSVLQETGEVDISFILEGLGYVLVLQGKEGEPYLVEAASHKTKLGYDLTEFLKTSGDALVRKSKLDEAEDRLAEGLRVKQKRHDIQGLPEIWNSYALLREIQSSWMKAEESYRESLTFRWVGRRYFEAGALTGLIRVKHAQGDNTILPPLLTEAEQLAQQYEYNDHLTSLRLTQGHVAWSENNPEWEQGFNAALSHYQQALVYALRFNRFLLDEVLWGGGVGTPLRPLIPHCLERDQAGRRMLQTLRDWWRTGTNDVGTPRTDTISSLPEGISLLAAERLAREREPGDGSPQRLVVDVLTEALGS